MSTRVPDLTPEAAFDLAVLCVEAHVNAAHEGQAYPWLCHECRRYEAAEQQAAHAYGLAIDPADVPHRRRGVPAPLAGPAADG